VNETHRLVLKGSCNVSCVMCKSESIVKRSRVAYRSPKVSLHSARNISVYRNEIFILQRLYGVFKQNWAYCL
jgi:hypothetical protein